MTRDNNSFKEYAKKLAMQLAVKYKEDFPQIIFTVEELTELFYKRIITPPHLREVKKEQL